MPLHTDQALERVKRAAAAVGGFGPLARLAGVDVDTARRMMRKTPPALVSLGKLEAEAVKVLEPGGAK